MLIIQLNDQGRVLIPAPLRHQLNLADRSFIEMEVVGDKIVIGKHTLGCSMCGSETNLYQVDRNKFCYKCLNKLQDRTEWERIQ